MLKADLYNFEGKKREAIALPKEYDVKPNLNLLSQAVHVYEDRGHFGLARAKTRSEVAISTKKIYKQKGTGGARHGAKSAPIFVGGGVAHGPTGIKRVLHLSKSQKSKALLYALKYKASASKVVFAEGLDKIKKTKDAFNLVEKIIKDKNWKTGKNIMIALSVKNSGAFRSFRNIDRLGLSYYKDLNAYGVYLANGLIIDKEALEEKVESTKIRKEETDKKSVKSRTVITEKKNIKRKTNRLTKTAPRVAGGRVRKTK